MGSLCPRRAGKPIMTPVANASWARGAHPTPFKQVGFWQGDFALLAKLDARWFQIAFLSSFLLLGALARDFALTWPQVALTFTFALATQAAWQWGLKLPNRNGWGGYLSAIVSAFGISILVRADSLWVHPLLACIAMSSKIGRASCRERVLMPV